MSKIKINKKILLVIAAVLTVVLVGLIYRGLSVKHNDALTVTSDGKHKINLQPPTEEEQQQANAVKDNAVKRQKQDQQAPTSTGSSPVTPIISSWGQDAYTKDLSVAGYIPGIFEDGGTCTLDLESSGSKVNASQSASKNVSTVSCGYIAIPRTQLSSGDWTATISYSSPTSQGTSAPTEITVK